MRVLVGSLVLAFCVVACSSSSTSGDDDDLVGSGRGSDGGSSTSVTTPSCVVALTGVAAGSWPCTAAVLIDQNQLEIVIADDGTHAANFDFVDHFPDNLDLPAGSYTPIAGTSNDLGLVTGTSTQSSVEQWEESSISGEGKFTLTITAAGTKNAAGYFPGTKGWLDMTLVPVPGTASSQDETVHVDFVTGTDFPDAGSH